MFPKPQTARLASILPWILPTLLPAPAAAQGAGDPDVVEAYFRALGEHFRVSPAELDVLAAWGLPPEHLAVALFVARCSGGSADAVIAQRRKGLPWAEIARGSGLDASSFHVLPGGGPPGRLARIYDRFDAVPRAEWSSIELRDAEIVDLVNIRFLESVLGVAPFRVLEVATRFGSFVAAYDRLESGR